MKKTIGRKSDSRNFCFYLVEPAEDSCATNVAKKLMSLDGVTEVHVTDGQFGFVAKAQLADEKETDKVKDYLERNHKGRYGKVTAHYSFRK